MTASVAAASATVEPNDVCQIINNYFFFSMVYAWLKSIRLACIVLIV